MLTKLMINYLYYRKARVSFILLISILLGSCGGGGGGGGSSASSSPTYVASDFETSEYNEQYGLASISASTAYADGYSGSDVTVAVIDTGVDSDHPDLDNQMASGGYDYYYSDSDPNPIAQGDSMSHGTHVAGIIAAEKNSTGMHGIAYNAKILDIRIFNSAGTLKSYAKLRSAIDRAIDQGAKVINASFGNTSISSATANNGSVLIIMISYQYMLLGIVKTMTLLMQQNFLLYQVMKILLIHK